MLATSPEATGKPRRAFVDTALALDEIAYWHKPSVSK